MDGEALILGRHREFFIRFPNDARQARYTKAHPPPFLHASCAESLLSQRERRSKATEPGAKDTKRCTRQRRKNGRGAFFFSLLFCFTPSSNAKSGTFASRREA